MFKNKKGFSLIEILLTLAITVMLTVSAFATYLKVKDGQNVNRVVSQINQIREAARQLYSLERTYLNVKSNTLVLLDLIPKEMINSNNTLINPYGGIITVGSSPGNNNLRFNIIYYNVPAHDCIKIASIINQSVWSVGIAEYVGEIKNENLNLRFSVDKAEELCNYGNKSNVNMLFQSS